MIRIANPPRRQPELGNKRQNRIALATSRIALDWSRLLGFDQVASADTSTGAARRIESTLDKVGAKVGIKPPPVQAPR